MALALAVAETKTHALRVRALWDCAPFKTSPTRS